MDVALELVGLPLTMRQAVQSLAILGRAALVGLTRETFEIAPYAEVLNKEAEIIGVSDHLASEIPLLLDLGADGKLDLVARVLSERFRSKPAAVNGASGCLEKFGDDVCGSVITALISGETEIRFAKRDGLFYPPAALS